MYNCQCPFMSKASFILIGFSQYRYPSQGFGDNFVFHRYCFLLFRHKLSLWVLNSQRMISFEFLQNGNPFLEIIRYVVDYNLMDCGFEWGQLQLWQNIISGERMIIIHHLSILTPRQALKSYVWLTSVWCSGIAISTSHFSLLQLGYQAATM